MTRLPFFGLPSGFYASDSRAAMIRCWRHAAVICMGFSIASCDTTEPLDTSAIDGNWTFSLTRQRSNCGTANAIGISALLYVTQDGIVLSAPSRWWLPSNGVNLPLSGAINLDTGLSDLLLSSGIGTMRLVGEFQANGAFVGEMIDPADLGFSPALGAEGCEYDATGVKQ